MGAVRTQIKTEVVKVWFAEIITRKIVLKKHPYTPNRRRNVTRRGATGGLKPPRRGTLAPGNFGIFRRGWPLAI